MSQKDLKFDNLIIFDLTFIIVSHRAKIDYLNELYLILEGKTRFFIFKQTLEELEGKTVLNPLQISFQQDAITKIPYLEKFAPKAGKIKQVKIRKQYKSIMKYFEKNEKIYPLNFVDEIKEKNETTLDFLLKWCLRLKKKYKNVFLAANDINLRKMAKTSKINTIFLKEKKLLKIERN
ncbi:MAG: PIN domain-containing protein [Promethearchaeota archaeon]